MSTRRGKAVIHRIFDLCKAYTPDLGWKDFLSECSYGRFPAGIKFMNSTIICTRKKDSFAEELPREPERAFVTIIEIFRDRLNIKTLRERNADDLIFAKAQKAVLPKSWSEIRTISGKSSLLAHFTTDVANYYGMNMVETRRCLATLELGLATKLLDKTRIHVTAGKITKIDGFYFDEVLRVPCLLGNFKPIIPYVEERPLDFVPVKQINVVSYNENVLNKHTDKMKVIRA
tara:strand:- start:30213 stop:30905 length:693 start_codon:yes stop_codon:yes gene_type:complete